MRALVAFDKFKDALTARAACAAAANALRTRHPDWQLDLCPLTDGGEGFSETLTEAAQGRFEIRTVAGPHGPNVEAPMGIVAGEKLTASSRTSLGLKPESVLAVIELATASGLQLVPRAQRDPWRTTTLGTGALMAAAAQQSADAILLGVGGSATNDLGLGALAALGFKFIDATGSIIRVPTPTTWEKIERIDCSHAITLPPIFIACDVTNPLLGPEGAATTFGPQKGLTPADLPKMEAQATRLAALLCQSCAKPIALAATPGAGAAGGIAFGLMVAAGARLVPGFALVSAWLDLPARLAAADLIITGEGRFDVTSLAGKGPGSLVREAQRLGKPAYVFAGSLGLSPQARAELHGVKTFAITPDHMPLADALPHTAEFLADAMAREL